MTCSKITDVQHAQVREALLFAFAQPDSLFCMLMHHDDDDEYKGWIKQSLYY